LRCYSCGQPSKLAQVSIPPDSDEYAVYSAVINKAVAKRKAKFAVIDGRTVFYENIAKAQYTCQPIMKPLTQEMLQNLIRKNGERYRLSESLKLNVQYVLLGNQAAPRTYPASAIFSLSKVWFNDKKDVALVYFKVNCGSLCGEGNLILLSRGNRGWEIREECRLWIS